jgi:hypothetical protein
MARSGCIYSPTGGRKTSQVKDFAHYIARKTGKSTLLLSTDGGGWDPCVGEVNVDMIRPYRCDVANMPLVLLRKISQGYWPVDPLETNPERIDLAPINYDEIGGIAVEGWSSISQVVMRYLPDQGISVGGEDRKKPSSNMAFAQQVKVLGIWQPENFGSNTRGDYGFVQNYLYGLVMNFNSLPVEYVLYTALESKTEDDDRSTTFGPAIAGKKGTRDCGAWVGDLIHGQDYPIARKVTMPDPSDSSKTIESDQIDLTVRFHFRKHLDPATGIPFPAKPRVTPEKTEALEKRFPGGYFEPVVKAGVVYDGFGTYLDVVDSLGMEQADTLKDWRSRMDQKLGRVPAAQGK